MNHQSLQLCFVPSSSCVSFTLMCTLGYFVVSEFNGLQGTLPSVLFELTALTNLHLARNELGGNIPSAIQNLRNLTFLDLGKTEGTIGPERLCDIVRQKQRILGSNFCCCFSFIAVPNEY